MGESVRGMRELYGLGAIVRKSRRGPWEQGEGEVACVSVSECIDNYTTYYIIYHLCVWALRGWATTSVGVGLDRGLGKRAGQLSDAAATGGVLSRESLTHLEGGLRSL